MDGRWRPPDEPLAAESPLRPLRTSRGESTPAARPGPPEATSGSSGATRPGEPDRDDQGDGAGPPPIIVGWTIATSPEVYAYPEVRAHIEAQARRIFTDKYQIEPTVELWRYEAGHTVDTHEGSWYLPPRWLRICESSRQADSP